MNKYIDAEKLIAEIKRYKNKADERLKIKGRTYAEEQKDLALQNLCGNLLHFISSHQQEQPDEQPEYGYLSTEYVHGRKSKWNVGDVLAYYICTSNEEGERPLGKIVNVEFDEEDGWIYTFEDERTWDEQSLIEEGVYKIIENGK